MIPAKIMLFYGFTYSMLITNQYGRTYKPKKYKEQQRNVIKAITSISLLKLPQKYLLSRDQIQIKHGMP